MAPTKHTIRKRKCEICRKRYGRKNCMKRKFLAKFPMDEDRCRQWVKMIGNEDLAYIPIEKLHDIKYVCEDHFHSKDFNKMKSRLKKWAVPSISINRPPLPDHLLAEFPCHIAEFPCRITDFPPYKAKSDDEVPKKPADSKKQNEPKRDHYDHTYSIGDGKKDVPDDGDQLDSEEHEKSKVSLPNPQQSPRPFDDDIADDGNNVTDILYSDDGDKDTKENQFSWQKATQICIDDDDDCDDVPTSMDVKVEKVEEGKPNDTNREDHKEYFCDSCCESIVGFRYRCVECEDYDLCSRCEAQAQHARHYMLRVPRPRPFSEIKIIIDAIREKIKQLSEELQDNSLELDEIKLEPDFVDPAALDPLCTPRVQTPHIATDLPSHEVPLCPPPIATSCHKGSAATLLTHQNEAAKSRPDIATSNEIIMTSGTVPTHIATLQFKTPLTTTSQTSHKWADRPVYIIRDYSQKRPKARRKQNNTFQKPQTVPVMLDPTVLIKKLNLIKDNKETHINLNKDEETHNEESLKVGDVGNTSKRKLTAFVEDSFNKRFKDMEETFKDCIENISDNGNTSGTGIKRKNIADIEETWLDEDILDEEVISTTEETDEDREECPSPRITRSATKAKLLSEEIAPDT